MNQLKQTYPEEVERILARYPETYQGSAIMPLLHLAQRETGTISDQSVADIAELTGASHTEITSVIGFYTLFHQEGGRYHIQVCTDLPCAMRGAAEFMKQVSEALGIKPGETTEDGLFTLEEVKCIAACNRSPVFQLQGDGKIEYHEHQTLETAMQTFDALRKKASGTAAAPAGESHD